MENEVKVSGADVPLSKLVPLKERLISNNPNSGFTKIISSIKSIGLIEPLCVYKEGENYVILDGYLRFKACQQLAIESVPCMCYSDKEGYTFNKMVSKLSASQQSQMLRKSLKTVDQSTIAQVFGIKSIQYRLGTNILADLHPKVVQALDKNFMSRKCATELTYLTFERQLEILHEMENTNDYSIYFCRALVVKTPPEGRNPKKQHKQAWSGDAAKKNELVAKLEAVEKRYDFYTKLYRQYATDILKISVYVRKIVTTDVIRDYLVAKAPAILERFEQILFEVDGKKPARETK